MFTRALRAVVTVLLRLWYRVDSVKGAHHALALEGPVLYVANHPNGLIDPGLLFVLIRRHVTFLAKAPLFRIPVLGLMLKAMGALPVFRKQDGHQAPGQNEGTLGASVQALVDGKVITLFPEGKSHSEPQLQALKTGCARIALEAVARGAAVKIVPVGLTYAEKHRFGSAVHVEVGTPIDARAFSPAPGDDAFAKAQALTDHVAQALAQVTLNLEAWEDLPLLETAEALYALDQGTAPRDPARRRAFATGIGLLRAEQPQRFEQLKQRLLAHRRQLELIRVTPHEVAVQYRPWRVLRFVVENLLWLAVGLPLFALGFVAFVVPYWVPWLVSRAAKADLDLMATLKVLTTLVLAPLWWALLAVSFGHGLGWRWGVLVAVAVPPLALFTRYFLERRRAAWSDARTFLLLASRARLKAGLRDDGAALGAEIEAVVRELRPRVVSSS